MSMTYTAGILPANLGWNVSLWPLTFGMYQPASGRRIGSCSITFDALFPGWRTRTMVFVDGASGSDANTGLSPAQSVRTLSKGLTVANSLPDVAVTMRVMAGTYQRAANFNYGNVVPAKDIVFFAYGGRVVVTGADTPTFAVDPSSAATWTAPLATCVGIADVTIRDAEGRYTLLSQVASAAICYVTPNSWALVSGTLYVHRADGAAPNAANTRVYRPSECFTANGDTQYNLGFTGDTDGDGFDFEGGNTGVINIGWAGITVPAAPKIFAMKNCSARYPGAGTGEGGILRVNNHHGLVFAEGCSFDLGNNDSINIHAYNYGIGLQTYLLTVNCSAHDSGSNQYPSCNAWTLHENIIGIDICGDYLRARGRTLHIVNTSKALIFGSVVGGSKGDAQSPGGVEQLAELRTDGTAELWVDSATLLPGIGAAPGFEMIATGGYIHLRNMPPPRSPRVTTGTGVIDRW